MSSHGREEPSLDEDVELILAPLRFPLANGWARMRDVAVAAVGRLEARASRKEFSQTRDQLAFMLRVLALVERHEIEESLAWRTDGEYAPLTFLIRCNDVFSWGTGDLERLTPENVDLFESTLNEVSSLEDRTDWPLVTSAPELFVARVRGVRPQGASYKQYGKLLWPLFDACGPERDPGEPGNTPKPDLCATCKETYAGASRGQGQVCSDAFHLCRACVWKDGAIVVPCTPCLARERAR